MRKFDVHELHKYEAVRLDINNKMYSQYFPSPPHLNYLIDFR